VAANLEKAAQTAGKPVKVSEPFDMGGPTNLLGSERLAAQFADVAFRMNPTNAISFQPLPGEDGIYIIALKESIPGRMQTFEEVKGQVEEDYRRFNAFTLARSDATNFIAQATNAIAGGKSFEEAAKQLNVKTESLPPIAQTTDTLTNLAERLNFRQLKSVLFSLEPGRVSGYIPNPPEGGYVVHVKSKLPFDEAKVKEELPKFLSELRSEKQNEIFNQWFRQQVEKANLPLNRPKTPGQS
jgi:parvulin-like peptidyl-prolyl isomerase